MAQLGQQLKDRFFYLVSSVKSLSFISYTQGKQETEAVAETDVISETDIIAEKKIGSLYIKTGRAFVLEGASVDPNTPKTGSNST
ncbi:hypothetical protein DsansV1_C26g0192891 [Dioscorea sansibarensis]